MRAATTHDHMSHRPGDWPDPVLNVDPDSMHPRAIKMADAMQEGTTTFRALIGAGFTAAEIGRFHEEARALAASREVRQITPSADRISEMVDKANAAIPNRMPMPKGASESQSMVVAWGRYCMARNAYQIDAWEGQRERCARLLRDFFRLTPLGEAVTDFVVLEADKTMAGARH